MEIKATRAFTQWMGHLRNRQARVRIRARIERLAMGNPGQHKVLSGGIAELKIKTGPGYRVYYTWRNDQLIVLLCGGDKSTQSTDIERAQRMATEL